jgi:RNA polymerase sigma factor (sigma-70 family)
MSSSESNPRLSDIQTLWSVVCQAHQESGGVAATARRQLLERYGGAARRYLLGVLRDPEAADEVFQELAVRLLQGDLHRADRQCGRFRDFLKGALFHLIAQYRRRERRQPGSLPADYPEPAASSSAFLPEDEGFRISWRDELLARAWTALERFEHQTGRPFYTVLRFRAEHADLTSAQLAAALGEQLRRPLTAAGIRQTLHRAREQFADFLLEEVTQALQEPTEEHLYQELNDLGLWDYCRPALQRRPRG